MDQSLQNVFDFHTAFGIPTPAEPGFPEMSLADRALVASYALEMADLARRLKAAAQVANLNRRGGLGTMLIRLQLIQEEGGELAEAIAKDDLVEACDALADLDYVVNGGWLVLGMAAIKAAACQAVHDSNMSKLDENGKPILSEAGRVIKGPNYQPPTEALRRLLENGL